MGLQKVAEEVGHQPDRGGRTARHESRRSQYWESDLRPVPRAVELACQELLRRWKQRPEVDSRPSGDLVLRCEPHPNNESALGRVVRLSETLNLFMPLIVDDDGTAVWAGPELLHECEERKRRDRQAKRIEA